MCLRVRVWMWKGTDGGCKLDNNDNERIGERERERSGGQRGKEIKGRETKRDEREKKRYKTMGGYVKGIMKSRRKSDIALTFCWT